MSGPTLVTPDFALWRSAVGLLEGALKFYMAERRGVPVILTPGIGGMPEIVTPAHPILRVSYLSPESAASDQAIAHAKTEVQGGIRCSS